MNQIIPAIIIAAAIVFAAIQISSPGGFGSQKVLLPANSLKYSFRDRGDFCDVQAVRSRTEQILVGTIVLRRKCHNLDLDNKPEYEFVVIDFGTQVVIAEEAAVIPLD